MTKIKLLILDVDGVLTSGELPYLDAGGEVKPFHVQDGAAIKLWKKWGGVVAIISGRNTPAVEKRAKDLGVQTVIQGVADKQGAYEQILADLGFNDMETAAVGDEWLDIPLIQRCGYGIAVANALPVVKRMARYVTRRRGGEGVAAEVVERLLRHNGVWNDVVASQCVPKLADREGARRSANGTGL
ncbi:MAG TPA: HAD hydrolase family protein [Phycisphaerae bacterium]|nr:HAD hydrolase family protein [Phycisphaerae bacterium]